MRMIDADSAKLAVSDYKIFRCQLGGLMDVAEFIDDQPTIDAVPVVRCGECIAYTPVDDNTGKCVFLIGKHQYVVPDGYCYLGERKEGAD